MARLLTLCLTLLLVTASHSDGQTQLTVDTAENQSDGSLQGRTSSRQPEHSPSDQFNKSKPESSQLDQFTKRQPKSSHLNQFTKSQSEKNLQGQTNKSEVDESLSNQTNIHFPRNFKGQTNKRQPDESLQYQVNNRQLEKSLQHQTDNSWPGKTVTGPPDQALGRTSLNDLYIQNRPKTGRDIFRRSTSLQQIGGITNTENSHTKKHSPGKGVFTSTIGGHHTNYATTVSPVQPVTWVNSLATQRPSYRALTRAARRPLRRQSVKHLSTMQTTKRLHSTDHTMRYTLHSSAQPTTIVQQRSTVSHTPVGEGVVWSRQYGFFKMDLGACSLLQLHNIVIPLKEEEHMDVQWQTLAIDNAAETATATARNVPFTCTFRVMATDSRYLSGKLYKLELSGGVLAGLNVTIAGGKKVQHLYQSVWDELTSPVVFPSSSSALVFTFQSPVGDHRGQINPNNRTLLSAYASFHFFLTSQSGYQLENKWLHSGMNQITSFGFDEFTHYAYDTDTIIHITETGTVVSFPHFDLQDSVQCQADRLTLSKLQYTAHGAPEYTEIWSQCGNKNILVQVYNHHLALHFVSDSSHSCTGFKMLYTTHTPSQLPQQLDSGLFNCSVPNYPDFHFHFHCNVERECVAGEDEAVCSYTSTDCGPDHIHINYECYLYLPVRREITWYGARELCQRQGRRLIRLQNQDDWNAINMVQIRKKTSYIYLNFGASREGAKALFGAELHLPNHYFASRPGIHDSDYPSPHCAYSPALALRTRLSVMAIHCNTSLYVHLVLCDQENATTQSPLENYHVQEKAEWWVTSQSNVHVNLTACSASTLEQPWLRYHMYVEDGMKLYVSGVNSAGFLVCNLRLVTRHNYFMAVVMEKFDVDMKPTLAEKEKMYTLLGIFTGLNKRRQLHYWPNYKESDFQHAFVVVSNESMISFHIQSEGGARSIYLQLHIFVTSRPGTDHLSHLPVPPQGGIFTSFAFDGHTRYAHETSAAAEISAYGSMISFSHFDLQFDPGCQSDKLQLSLYQIFKTSFHYLIEWTKCGREDILPFVYTTPFVIRFNTGSSQGATGFKMLYSLHLYSQVPHQSRRGLFNCSVSNYQDFRLHFHCNLERECVAGEDEADCPYTSTDCGSDHIDAGNKCYLYLPVRREMAWYDASQLCQSHGERLVSPRTPGEWSTFQTIADYGKKTFGVFVGLSTSPSSLQAMYREVWWWQDQTMAFYINAHGQKLSKPTCAYLPPIYRDMLETIRCEDQIYVHYVLCEKDKVPVNDSHMQVRLHLPNTVWPDSFFHCPQGHVTHSFLSCDFHAQCGVTKHVSSCSMLDEESMPMFECDNGLETVHYTLVCDHRQDCADNSDEKWCQHAACTNSHVTCKNKQCVAQTDWCDGMRHCVDSSDEDCLQSLRTIVPSVPPPAVVTLDGYGRYDIRALDAIKLCPVTHFRCSPRDYCLPVYMHCNGVFDCPGHEDEEHCNSYTCPGFYRCRASSVCVHSQHVCDGVFQCPQQDDEWLCDVTCPQFCRCQGLAFTCNQSFTVHIFHSLRYLDASGSKIRPRDLEQNNYLVRLSLSRCGLTTVDNMTLPNLRWLDLSANTLTTVSMQEFAGLKNLHVLRLAQNPLSSLVPGGVDTHHLNLHILDLSLTELLVYHGHSLTGFPHLTHLNISHGTLTTISEEGLISTPSLQVLDVRGSPLDNFPQHLLRDLFSIHTVYADNFKLCCWILLPDGFNPNNCHAPLDEIASCDDLLRSNAYRVSLWFMAVMALVGNAGSFVYRVLWREAAKTGFHVFVSNLCLADLLMGLYLTVIGVADAVYRGEYLWNDKLWKDSAACQVAGFLSLLSSEVSAFFICLITLDRFIILRFPFSQVRFHTRSALAASALAWTGGCLLAFVPLLPMTSHWRFYSQTGICIPLPITRATFKGWAYSFGVMVVFNFVLFVLIALGQLLVFLSVRMNSITGSRGEQDAIIARRLTTIVLTDFLCWFPIGLLGLLASTGTPISSELNVGMAIFVLPFNSALNPFLYTFNVFMEKRRKAAEARLLETLKRQACI